MPLFFYIAVIVVSLGFTWRIYLKASPTQRRGIDIAAIGAVCIAALILFLVSTGQLG